MVLKTKSKTALSFIREWEKAEGIKKWFSDIFETIENNILYCRVESTERLKTIFTKVIILNIIYYEIEGEEICRN